MLFDKNAKQVDKYMCEACGLIKFVVDEHISQLNFFIDIVIDIVIDIATFYP